MITIVLNNNKSRIIGDAVIVEELRKLSRLRPQGYFFAPSYGKHWDGFTYYISDLTGMFPTGMLEWVITQLKRKKIKYHIDDRRPTFKDMHEPTQLGGKDFRGYQAESVKALLNHTIDGHRFQRGILHEATNAGKNLISAGIFMSFSSKRKGIFLIDNTEIFRQALEELNELMPDDVGQVSSRKTDLSKRITVCMVQTLAIRLKKDIKVRSWLGSIDMVIVDEADTTANRKDCKVILGYTPEATIRVAVSGTPLASKDKTRNQNIVNYFGPVLHHTSNKELVQLGHSSKPDIRMYMGNCEVNPGKRDMVWADEYRLGIIENKKRHRRIWKQVIKFKKRMPMLILFKIHQHGKNLLKAIPHEIKDRYTVELVNSTTPDRAGIFKRYKEGKIDILISSMIIRRGKNLPLTQTLINAAGGESKANTLQILGRLLRKHESKKKVVLVDFWDLGINLHIHSRRRLLAYKNEKFPVKEVYKKKLKDYNKK